MRGIETRVSLRLHSARSSSIVPSHTQILRGVVLNHTGLSDDFKYTIPQLVLVILRSDVPMHVDRRTSCIPEYVCHDLDVLVNTSLYVHLKTAKHDRDEPGQMSQCKHIPGAYFKMNVNSPASTRATDHVKVLAWQWVPDARQDLVQYKQGRQPAHASAVKTDQAEVLLIISRRLRHGHVCFLVALLDL